MPDKRLRRVLALSAAALGLAALAACATRPPEPSESPPAAMLPMPPAFQPQELVGRWGFASYHDIKDQARTEKAARQQCGRPYVIGRGPSGGVMMHLADEREPRELILMGAAGGRTFLGPGPQPGGPLDREVVSFDGRVLALRWLDPDVAGRYGVGVFVRCAPQA